MTDRPMLAVEEMALRAKNELDQLEGDYLRGIGSGDPVRAAACLRLFGEHLRMTLDQLWIAMQITEAELALTTDSLATGMTTDR